VITALVWAAILAAGAQDARAFRKSWGLTPADPGRPGLWKARPAADEAPLTVLVRLDTALDGSWSRCEWSAESGRREADLPESRFWSVLDGLSGSREWVETDPDALPDGVLGTPRADLAQGFRCPTCQPVLVAATWSPHGGTRLLVARSPIAPSKQVRLDIGPGIREDGLFSLARQKGFATKMANPCREGGGTCGLELSGPAGETWILGRVDGTSPWHLRTASFPGSAWWNPEWDWDSLRLESPREFRLMLRNWLDAELDVIGARLVRPLEPVLSASTSDWNARRIPGLSVVPAVDRLSTFPSAPSSVVLSDTAGVRVSVDGFGRRTIEIVEDKK
jgi:hypothetical protein